MPSLHGRLARVAALVCAACVFGSAAALAPPPPREDDAPASDESAVIRDGFESARTVWTQEHTDATIVQLEHDRSNRAAHEGRTSEHIHFRAGIGSGFYFSYELPKVPVTEGLKTSLFVRANRAGVQLFARVVLPADTDPETGQPSFVLVPGTIYEDVDRWQRLEVLELRPSLERQVRVLRASTKRPVRLDGAFIEQVVVNLFAGAGDTEVFLDELSLGPVPARLAAAHAQKASQRAPGPEAVVSSPGPSSPSPALPRGPLRVRLDNNRLKKRDEDGLFRDWFFTAIHAPGADLASLRNAGFDVLIDDLGTDPQRFKEARAKGFMLMPRIGSAANGGPVDSDQVIASAKAFPFGDSVVAWDLGERLGRSADAKERRDQLQQVRALITRMRSLPAEASHVTTGLIDDDLPRYSRAPQNLNILGIRPSAWGSSYAPVDTYAFLRQRRDLTVRSNPGALYWALLPAAPPAAVPLGVWGQDEPPPGGSPVVQAEQVRLFAFTALASGYRGLAFRGDAELTRARGRILLLEMAMLNAEIDLCESILANGSDPIPIYRAFDPDPSVIPPLGSARNYKVPRKPEQAPLPGIHVASIGTRDRKGVLLVVTDFAYAAQFQPPQMARNDVKITVIAPEGAQAFEISPGRVRRGLERERTPGGTRITLPEFDTTALVLVTTDVDMADRIEAAVDSIRPRAVQMAIEQAQLKLDWVTDTNGKLAAGGHYLIEEKERKKRAATGGPLPTDQVDLLVQCAANIKAARENLEREDYANAWSEARRASRPLRVLMRGLWQNAYDAMVRANTPAEDLANEEPLKTGRAKRVGPPQIVPSVASPPLLSFNTLPQHYVWVDWMRTAHFGRNLLPTGTFNHPESLEDSGWVNQGYQYEGIQSKVVTKANEDAKSDDSGRSLKMIVEPAEGASFEELPPFLDFPAAAIRSPAVPVKAGQLLRISVFVQRPVATAGGAGGVIVRDSLGGEALQFVSSDPIPELTRIVLYRRAAEDADLTVTLGLAGYGEVIFDNLTIERVEAASAPPDVARLPRPGRGVNGRPIR
jgi:hypothetical protein